MGGNPLGHLDLHLPCIADHLAFFADFAFLPKCGRVADADRKDYLRRAVILEPRPIFFGPARPRVLCVLGPRGVRVRRPPAPPDARSPDGMERLHFRGSVPACAHGESLRNCASWMSFHSATGFSCQTGAAAHNRRNIHMTSILPSLVLIRLPTPHVLSSQRVCHPERREGTALSFR